MLELTLKELDYLYITLDDLMQQHEMPEIAYEIKAKLELMIEDNTPEPKKSLCKCGDKYHLNGAICL
jgi:hypothetical protein